MQFLAGVLTAVLEWFLTKVWGQILPLITGWIQRREQNSEIEKQAAADEELSKAAKTAEEQANAVQNTIDHTFR